MTSIILLSNVLKVTRGQPVGTSNKDKHDQDKNIADTHIEATSR